jgi:nitrogen fixation/metabolism regulation signal transduction histidine kinase
MKKRVVKLTESDLERLVKRVIKEKKFINEGGEPKNSRYMFFSNLEQIHRQAVMLMEMDENMLNQILENGHDWAQDHIAEAKNNMDQVFDFIMNEIKDPEHAHGRFDHMDQNNNMMEEKWSQKYKNSIDCNDPKGFSQRAYCQGKKKRG